MQIWICRYHEVNNVRKNNRNNHAFLFSSLPSTTSQETLTSTLLAHARSAHTLTTSAQVINRRMPFHSFIQHQLSFSFTFSFSSSSSTFLSTSSRCHPLPDTAYSFSILHQGCANTSSIVKRFETSRSSIFLIKSILSSLMT